MEIEDPRADSDDCLAEFGFDDDTWLDRLREAENEAPWGRAGVYEIREEIGRGGQGVVYRARDPRSGRDVAIKCLVGGALASPANRRRFSREISAAASLRHRNVVTWLGVTEVHGQPAIVLEWIDGAPIDRWAAGDGARRPVDAIVRVVTQVADAIRHAHQRGVLHRDLKPSNVLVDADDVAHVLDFGLAKSARDTSATFTATGQFLGTPAYASPEQVRGSADAFDVRSDVYALGVLFYELLAGRMPYDLGRTLVEAFESIERTEPARLRSLAPDVPADLEAIVAKMLEKDPARRYQSVDSLLTDLDAFRRGLPVAAREQSALYSLRRSVRRHRVAVSVVAVGLLVALGWGTTMAVLLHRSERERTRTAQVQAFLESTLLPEGSSAEAVNYRLVDLLTGAASRIDAEFADEPELAARLRLKITEIYAQLWRWDDVAREARLALPALRAVHGDESEPVAHALFLLGEAAAFRDDPEAIALEEESLRIRRRLFGDESRQVAAALSGLALACWRSDTVDGIARAEASYREAVSIYDRRKEETSFTSAGTNYSFAAFLYARGRYAESVPRFERALALYDELPEAADVHRLRCQENYAWACLALPDSVRAERAFRESVAARPEGSVDESLPETLRQIGLLCEARGDVEQAEDWFRRSLAAAGSLPVP
ncbi:MAG: serine/threonine-protein kinase [bacterium]